MANLRIKKKHIDENAIDGTKIKLLQNEAIKVVNAQGSVVDLVKLDASGFVEGNGKTLATYEQLVAKNNERTSADSSLDFRLDVLEGEETVDGSVKKSIKVLRDYVDDEIATEESLRISSDEFLLGLINDEINNRIADVGDEQSARIIAVGDEQSARIIADESLETAYSLAVSSEASARSSADTSLSSRIDTLQGDEDTSGSLLKIYNDSKIYTNVKVSAEKSERVSADDSLELYVIFKDASLTTAIATETGERRADDQLINSRITNIETSLLGKINTEEGSRKTADSSLSSRLGTVQGDENTAGSINKALKDAKQYTDEKAINVSASVVTLINTEITSRQTAVSDEAAYRVAGDGSLSARLNVVQADENTAGSIAKALKDAKDYANGKFDQEKAWRESADTALSQRIDRVLSNADPAALDSLAEIVQSFQSVDGTLSGAITNISFNIKSDLSVEVTSRIAAVSSLDTRVHNTELRLNTIEGNGEGSIYQAQANAYFYTDEQFKQEKTWRTNADASLDTKINNEISTEAAARYSVDEDLDHRLQLLEGDYLTTGSIANMLSSAKQYTDDEIEKEEGSRTRQINQETSNRITAVNNEADTRRENDDALSGRITTEVNDRVNAIDREEGSRSRADSSLSSQISTESSTRATIVQNIRDDIALEASARIEGDFSLEILIGDEKLELIERIAAEAASRREAIADLVDSAPEVLDTLKELADALGGDQNFATTIADRLGALEGSITAATSALEGSVTAAISTAEGYTDTEKQDVLALISNTLVQQETLTITAQNVQDGFVSLTGVNIVPRSMMVFIDRLCMFENVDYSLSVVDGVTNLTFLNSFAAGGVEEIDENTALRVTYWSIPL